MPEFELVLPAYNEAQNLKILLDHVVIAARKSKLTPELFQLVLVQNGSSDESQQVLDSLGSTELGQWFRTVKIEKNRGYGFGIFTGLQTTTAPIVGWSHADLQCDPSYAMKAFHLLKAFNDEKKIVKGTRFGRNWKDQFVSFIFRMMAKFILGIGINEINAQPKVFRRALLEKLENPPFTFAFDLYVLYKALKNGYRIQTIDVIFPPRIHGTSKWAATFLSRYKTIFGMIRYMWNLSKSEGRM